MKLRVQTAKGETQTLEIATPITAQQGPHMDRIVGADGTEYFFTKDGYYDGWGFSGKRC
jgi:hypothetical protein